MVDFKQTKEIIGDTWHIVFLVLLIGLLLGSITWLGIIRCSQIPGWCSIYSPIEKWISGKRDILIVYGTDGLGDPELLQQVLRNPNYAGVSADVRPISLISKGNLDDFQIVIVEKAKTMSSQQMQYFLDYADSGGKLIWTGDAGTKLAQGDELLYESDIDVNGDKEKSFGPWARKYDNRALRLDQYISVQYIANYCDVVDCTRYSRSGNLVPEPGADHPLIYGVSPALSLYGDFALVKEPESVGAKRVLSLDHGSIIYLEEQDIGRYFPVIVTSGLGEKIAYYSVPPEQFTKDPMNYYLFAEKLWETYR